MNRRMACLLAVLLLAAPAARGELLPGFDLEEFANTCPVIVRGRLDAKGDLTVAKTLVGRVPGEGPLPVAEGKDRYKEMAAAMKADGPVEVVAFLQEKTDAGWPTRWGSAGLVGFDGDTVYLCLNDGEGAPKSPALTFLPQPGTTRDKFLRTVDDEIRVAAERRQLLGQPRSADRARKLLALLVASGKGHGYGFRATAAGLRSASAAEERVVGQALKDAADDGDRRLLLDLTGAAGLAGLFEDVAAWTPRGNPGEVRRAAAEALNRLDGYRAAGRLAPLLAPDDPELEHLLAALGPSDARDAPFLNRDAADAVLVLAATLRPRLKAPRPGGFFVNPTLAWRLQTYARPETLPLLYEWAQEEPVGFDDCPLRALQAVTGLDYPRKDVTAWSRWWEGARPLLSVRYDLDAAAGRKAWRKAFAQADEATRRVLVRQWFFDPQVDQEELVKIAGSDDGAEAAQAVLAEMWRRGSLKVETKQAIVKKFLTVRLEEQPDPTGKRDPAWRELRLVGERAFPFPKDCWVQVGYSIAVGESVPKLSDSHDVKDLGGTGPVSLGGSAGRWPGAPAARALLEVRQVEPGTGKVVWAVQWSPGPITLRNSEKP
jgi:hypothetical protein